MDRQSTAYTCKSEVTSKPNKKVLNCAIYTRKSTSNGLEQDFNTLQAQRETCEAYILSQKHAGWVPADIQYNDGGFSGGNTERPAFKKLMQDIKSGIIDIVVVYKVDRLTRSIRDFAKIVDQLDSNNASFVSVTQHFNTTNAMGRLTLNVLLSFAQFEREVSSERVRDKIAASKQKGIWVGGHVPLGYDAIDKMLVINKQEAGLIQLIYDQYIEFGNANDVAQYMNSKGYVTKQRISKLGKNSGGLPFIRSHIYYILSNATYIGQINHKGKFFDGLHEGIVDEAIWSSVQNKLKQNAYNRKTKIYYKDAHLLSGLIYDQWNNRLSPTHSSKKGKRYRYYVSRSILTQTNHQNENGWRISAWELENSFLMALNKFYSNPKKIIKLTGLDDHSPDELKYAFNQLELQSKLINRGDSKTSMILINKMLVRVILTDKSIKIKLQLDALTNYLKLRLNNKNDQIDKPLFYTITQPLKIKKRGVETKLVIGGETNISQMRIPNTVLIKGIIRGRAWFKKLRSGEASSIDDLSKQLGLSRSYVSRGLALAFASPKLIDAALTGNTNSAINVNKIIQANQLPSLWLDQEKLFGVTSRG